ncbi:unnamed protein product [Ixodes persulcatus]
MPDETGNATQQRAPAPPTVKNRQRDPPVFSGAPEADVNDWLKSYDRASQHNRWDDSFKLANVVFFLKDTALQWFDNHEDEIDSWEAFQTAFAEVFGKPESRKQQAKDKLARRYQSPTESSTAYIEDVLRLCRRVDNEMTEEDKIRHLFKGLSHDLFTVVAPKSPPTVQQLISECKRHEELQSARIMKRPFERLPEVCTSNATPSELPELIRQIIRQELQAYLAPLHAPDVAVHQRMETPSVQKVVQDELRAALNQIQVVPPIYAPTTQPSTPLCPMVHDIQSRYRTPFFDRAQPPYRPYGQRRRTDIWRTDDQRPVCFYCHAAGHIARYCRRRMTDNASYRVPASFSRYSRNLDASPPSEAFLSDARHPTDAAEASDTRRRRSPSPYPTRRRSLSPFNRAAVASTPSSN